MLCSLLVFLLVKYNMRKRTCKIITSVSFIFFPLKKAYIKSKFIILIFSFSELEFIFLVMSLLFRCWCSESSTSLSQGGFLSTSSDFFSELMGIRRGSWRFGGSKERVYSQPPPLSLATLISGLRPLPRRPSRFKSSMIFVCSVMFLMFFFSKSIGQTISFRCFMLKISVLPREVKPNGFCNSGQSVRLETLDVSELIGGKTWPNFSFLSLAQSVQFVKVAVSGELGRAKTSVRFCSDWLLTLRRSSGWIDGTVTGLSWLDSSLSNVDVMDPDSMTASKCKLQELREPLLCLDLEREDCFTLPFADLLGEEPMLSVFASDRGRIQEKLHGA